MEGSPRSGGRLAPFAAGLAVLALWLALAAALHRRNAVWESQEALWRDAVAKAPGKARAYLSLGFALREQGDYDGAIAVYREGLGVVGGDVAMELQLLRNLSAALIWASRYDEATQALQRAMRLDPLDTDILTNLAVVWLARRDLDLAERFARRALAVQPQQGDAWNALGAVLLDRGDLAGAEQALTRAVRLDPDVGVRSFNLARVHDRRGETAAACAAWGQALRARLAPSLRGEVERLRALRACPP